MVSNRKTTFYPDGVCEFCKHFHEKISPKGFVSCNAFPEGIPFIIGAAQFDHRNPHPNDNGIRFEIKEGLDIPNWVERLYGDNATKLMRGFQRFRRHNRSTWHSFWEGRYNRSELIERLASWLLLDWENNYWTLGNDDNEWYKLVDEVWIQTEAPFTLEQLNEIDSLLTDEVTDDQRFFLQPGSPKRPDISDLSVRKVFESVAIERIAIQQNMKTLFEKIIPY